MSMRIAGGGVLLVVLLIGPQGKGDVFDNVPEASGYTLVHTLPIPTNGNFSGGTSVPYTVDNSATVGAYDRIAYYLELDTGSGLDFAYASINAFDFNAGRIGLPHSVDNPVERHLPVSGMNVVSNVMGMANGTGIATGNIEMWPSNYNQTGTLGLPGQSNSAHDWDDGNNATTSAGYGSFQVHNWGAGQTVLAYNRWGSSAGDDDVGIGNSLSGGSDWTFAANTGTYAVKNLQVLVRELPGDPFTAEQAGGTGNGGATNYGQSFTPSVAGDGTPLASGMPDSVLLRSFTLFAGGNNGSGDVYLNVYDGLIDTNDNGPGQFVGSSIDPVRLGFHNSQDPITFLFDDLLLDYDSEYFAVFSTTNAAGDITDAGQSLRLRNTGIGAPDDYLGGTLLHSNGILATHDARFIAQFTTITSEVPEPGMLPFYLAGLLGLAVYCWRRKNNAAVKSPT